VDDDLTPECDDYESPPVYRCPEPREPSVAREALVVFLGALASAAAPEVLKFLRRLGRRLVSDLREPEATRPNGRKRKDPDE
jgi:hypothetical protein